MKGILFKPWKIKAIAEDDREWMTRRLGGLKEINQEPDKWVYLKGSSPKGKFHFYNETRNCRMTIKPRYQVGEVVYIKEGWTPSHQGLDCIYKLDAKEGELFPIPTKDWRSPLFMPEWAARYFEKITDTRAERLQEITYGDCMKEGLDMSNVDYCPGWDVSKFKSLWNSINAKWKRVYNKKLKIYEFWQFPWAEEDAVPIPKTTQHPERYHCIPNPWLFVYSFKKVEK